MPDPDEVRRRRRAAELLGETVPRSSADEQEHGWGEDTERRSRDEDLRRDVPPHHGQAG